MGPRLEARAGAQILGRTERNTETLTTRFCALPKSGDHLTIGGLKGSSSAVTALLDSAKVPDPLSSDPSVTAVLGAVGTSFESLIMGTSYIVSAKVLFKKLPERSRELLEAESGLSHLHAGPVMVGVAYLKSSPMAAHVVAAALYPTTADASEALKTIARYTATGTSFLTDEPYRKLWQVNRTMAKGDLIVMDLTPKTAGSVSRALENSDFPLFWSP